MDTSIIEHKLCNKNDLANNSMKEIEIDLGTHDQKVKVLLIKQNNQFYCLSAKCSHYQVPLINGVLVKDRLRCFAHGACFNIKTGDIEDYPGPDCIPKYDVFEDQSNNVWIRTTVQELLFTKRIRPVKKSESKDLKALGSTRPVSANLNASNQLIRSLTIIQPKCLIIGLGAAGLLCLDTLREGGFLSNITVITKENYFPYDRPKLSKVLNTNINAISLRDEEYFKLNQINLHLNQEVDKIDFDKKEVYCFSGKVFNYDKLVIATGLRAVKLDQKPGALLNGIFTLRTYDNAKNIFNYFEKLSQQSSKKLNIVTVGGSFISMEIAGFFADKSNLTVMSRDKPFESIFGSLVSAKIQKLHESKGVKFYIHNKFDIIDFKESKENPGCLGSIRLNDESEWPVDICILAIGGKPVTDFLKNSSIKLTLDNYVYVDKYMKTSLDNVYAAGDITYFPKACIPGFEFTLHKNQKIDYINIAHWGLASSQGRIAGLSVLNTNSEEFQTRDESFKCLPFFWSAQHNKNIRFAGYNKNYDTIIFHDDKTKQNDLKFAAFYLLQNRVVGVCSLDYDPVCALYAEAMYNKIEIRKEHIENDPLDIKKLLE